MKTTRPHAHAHTLLLLVVTSACNSLTGLDGYDFSTQGASGAGGGDMGGAAGDSGGTGAVGGTSSGIGGTNNGGTGGAPGTGGSKAGASGTASAGGAGKGGSGGGQGGTFGGAGGKASGGIGGGGGTGGGASAGAGQGGASSTGGAGQGGGGGAGALDGNCVHNSDCKGGQVCSKIDSTQGTMFCQTPGATGADLGGVCTGNATCKSKTCDTSNTCTGACSTDVECGVGNVCIREVYSTTFKPDLCARKCLHDADCPTNGSGTNYCVLAEDIVSDTIVFGCQLYASPGQATSAGGTFKDFLGVVGANDGCVYAVQLTAGSYCTKPCTSNADCSGILPNCTTGSITNPSGNGTSIIKTCNM